MTRISDLEIRMGRAKSLGRQTDACVVVLLTRVKNRKIVGQPPTPYYYTTIISVLEGEIDSFL